MRLRGLSILFTLEAEVFIMCAYVRDNIQISSKLLKFDELQKKFLPLKPIKPNQWTCEDVEVDIGQDYYWY